MASTPLSISVGDKKSRLLGNTSVQKEGSDKGGKVVEAFVNWLSAHALASVLIVGSVIAVVFVVVNRKTLFYKQ